MARSPQGRDAIVGVAALLLLACSSEGPSGTPGSIQLAMNPATLSIQQGSNNSATASLTRGGGFNGAVTLAVTGLPSGVTTTVTPAQLNGTTTSATVGVTVAATVPVGTYTATVTATGQGVGNATATYQLTVTGAPNYALTVSPAALTIAAGASVGITVNINRTNFPGDVELVLVNPPAGITGAFNPSLSRNTSTSALTVSVAASVPAGAYTLTIQGAATGPGLKTTTLNVTVTAPPSGGNNVEYQYCQPSEAPVFFAYQDGSGAWQAVSGAIAGSVTKFAFNMTQARGGVLAVFRSSPSSALARTEWRTTSLSRDRLRERFGVGTARARAASRSLEDIFQTEVVYASTTELAQDGLDNCTQSGPTKTVTATIAGVTAGNFAVMSLGGSTKIFIPGITASPVTFTDVPAGLVDFIGTRTVPGMAPNRAFVLRSLNIPDGGSLPSTVDFLGTASFAPANATVTITGGAGDELEAYTELVTANGQGLLWNDLDPSPLATRPWGGLSASSMAAGDFHGLVVFASPPNNPDGFRVSIKYAGAVSNQTIAFGPKLIAPSATPVATGAYPRLRFQGTLPTEYNKGVSIDLAPSAGVGNFFALLATSAYLAASGNGLAYDLAVPDVLGVAGFPAAARITGGANDVFVMGFGFTGAGIFDLRPTLGTEFRAGFKTSVISVQ